MTSQINSTDYVQPSEDLLVWDQIEPQVNQDATLVEEPDATLGDDVVSSASSTSITSSVMNHVYENGRRYNAYCKGTYLCPNDEEELDRLDLQHHIWKAIKGGKLYVAPISDPLEILDVGTGTGIWAMEIADEFPAAQVTGTDISPVQPAWVPMNCKFYLDNLESSWDFGKQFDFIHGRALGGAISDWDVYCAEVFKHLKPGGWFEMQEFDAFFFCDDNTMKDDSHCVQWLLDMNRGSRQFGKDCNAAPMLEALMVEAGFVDIRSEILKVPVGTWAKDKRLKLLGWWSEAVALSAADAATVPVYTSVLGHSVEETQIRLELVKSEIRDSKIHKYSKYRFVCGQKPVDKSN